MEAENHDELAFQRFARTVERMPDHGTLLDVGSGDRTLVEMLIQHGLQVESSDLADGTDGAALPHGDASMDYVSAFEVLEHVEYPAKVAREMLRVARIGIFASVPWLGTVYGKTHRRAFTAEDLLALFRGAQVSYLPVFRTIPEPKVVVGQPIWYWVQAWK